MKEFVRQAKQVTALLRENQKEKLRSQLDDMHPADIADVIELLGEADRLRIFDTLSPERASDVLVELAGDARDDILDDLSAEELGEIIEEMDSDDAADIIQELEPHEAKALFEQFDEADRVNYNKLINYDEFSAGGIMQTELVRVRHSSDVDEAIEEIRRCSLEDEIDDVYNVYIVDELDRYIGRVPLQDLITARAGVKVGDILEDPEIFVEVTDDQEAVARKFIKYDLVTVPVVDDHHRLVGRISFDDILDVLEEEAGEDFMRMAGIGEDEEEIAEGGALINIRHRFPWLFITWIGGILISRVVSGFDQQLSHVVYLAAFMPIIAGMGGNIGTQSTTIVVRGLATGRIDSAKAAAYVSKELMVVFSLAAFFGVLLGVSAWMLHPEIANIGVTVGASIACSMAIAGLLGSVIPLVLFRLKIDPAVSTGPFVTTTTDIISISIYFGLANLFLLSG